MASPRDIRKLALLALYQFDARGDSDPEAIRGSLDDVHTLEEEGLAFIDQKAEFSEGERDKAFDLAQTAYQRRDEADAVLGELSKEWSVSRMPVVDRSILRLAFHEMHRQGAQPKAIVNEAVELAKAFSTANSPGFVNGILDKILKRVLAAGNGTGESGGVGVDARGSE